MLSYILAISLAIGFTLAEHPLIITNRCGDDLTPVVASCVDLQWNVPCNPYNGPQPGTLGAGGGSTIINVTDGWNGRVFVPANECTRESNGDCWHTGCPGCTLLEFNTDADQGLNYYDISNINSFTIPTAIQADGCEGVVCTSPECDCFNAYPQGDQAGYCGTDQKDRPVRACNPGAPIRITFCP